MRLANAREIGTWLSHKELHGLAANATHQEGLSRTHKLQDLSVQHKKQE